MTDTEILLGGSNSFSGPLAFTGTQLTKVGVDLYFRVLNDAGGVHGRKVRTVYYDDGYRPQDAVANTQKLVEQDGIFAVIAPQGSPPVVATLDYLEQGKVPMLFPVPELDRDPEQEVRLQRARAERPPVADDDRLPGRPTEVQAIRRPLPGRRVRQVLPDRVRGRSGAPQPQADRDRAGEARGHRRERADRQAPGREARGHLPGPDSGSGCPGAQGAAEDRLERYLDGLDGPADRRDLPGPGRRRLRRAWRAWPPCPIRCAPTSRG